MKHLKTLDSFRTFAVLSVIIGHWVHLPDSYIYNKIPLGAIGVTMFFVLSGFLITTILLGGRERISMEKASVAHVMKTFYIRRTLRIFPVYYLFILLLVYFFPKVFYDYPGSLYWCIFYVSNIYSYLHQHFVGYVGHLWSLAVEEQFYLLWPMVILFTPKRRLVAVIMAFITGAVAIKLGYEILLPRESASGMYLVLTPTCFDAFGIGGLLALFKFEQVYYAAFCKWIKWLALIAIPLFVLACSNGVISNVFLRLSISFPSAALIIILMEEKSGLVNGLFSNRVLTYLGKISYGLYLWHMPIPAIYPVMSGFIAKKGLLIPFTHYSILPFAGGNKQVFIYAIVLVAIASISWFFFEKPINDLKQKFDYKK